MSTVLLNWLDDRTGFRSLLHEALFERIPGGARWRYVWGSTLVFAFVTQMITGFVLWTAYSPSAQSAWESVFYIQNVMTGGALVRGIHHFMAQLMVVLLAIHFLQVVIDGAYRAPREFNFWIGLILLKLVLGLALTGYLLPWDQKGYWATKVATNIAGLTPYFGPWLERLAVGGSEYGHHTLTRFFALHAGLFPALLIAFLVLHIGLMRKHGLKTKEPYVKPTAHFWPDQVLMDAVACLAVLAFVLGLSIWAGAELTGPADPAHEYSAARPEWYFLFLFQLLKLPAFAGEREVLGAIVLPGLVMGFLFLMPLIGRWKLGHRFNILFVCCLLLGAAILTGIALWQDAKDVKYQRAVEDAEVEAARAKELALGLGIPPEGAAALMRRDPFTQGPRLFTAKCQSCHAHDASPPLVPEKESEAPQAPTYTAPDLTGFGTQAWLTGLLDPAQIDGEKYFGNTAHKGGQMSEFVHQELKTADVPALALALAAEGGHVPVDGPQQQDIARGRTLIQEQCTTCHKFHDQGELGTAPDLTGYGSQEWLVAFVSNPSHERFYGDENDRMPAFRENESLTPQELELLAKWLRGDWFRAAGAKVAETNVPTAPVTEQSNPQSEPATKADPATTAQPMGA